MDPNLDVTYFYKPRSSVRHDVATVTSALPEMEVNTLWASDDPTPPPPPLALSSGVARWSIDGKASSPDELETVKVDGLCCGAGAVTVATVRSLQDPYARAPLLC
jgi:hypothetical protein